MSAGGYNSSLTANRDLTLLAPKFREAVEKAIADCRARGYDAYVYEGYRSLELQQLYYARGRTIIPPLKPVTNAPTNLYSWHGYCLAVDVISIAHGWEKPEEWFAAVAELFKKVDCKWGGDWKSRDLPHFQWGPCKPGPSDTARDLIRTEGVAAVWKAVGAV